MQSALPFQEDTIPFEYLYAVHGTFSQIRTPYAWQYLCSAGPGGGFGTADTFPVRMASPYDAWSPLTKSYHYAQLIFRFIMHAASNTAYTLPTCATVRVFMDTGNNYVEPGTKLASDYFDCGTAMQWPHLMFGTKRATCIPIWEETFIFTERNASGGLALSGDLKEHMFQATLDLNCPINANGANYANNMLWIEVEADRSNVDIRGNWMTVFIQNDAFANNPHARALPRIAL